MNIYHRNMHTLVLYDLPSNLRRNSVEAWMVAAISKNFPSRVLVTLDRGRLMRICTMTGTKADVLPHISSTSLI